MFLRLLFATFLLASTAASAQDSADQPIKVEVKLVNVFATVTDALGHPVNTLTKDDFQLFEDDIPQKIAIFQQQSSLPLSIIVCIDTSLSTQLDLKFEQQSARRFAKDVVDPGNHDAMALYEFSRDVDELVPFTSSLHRIDDGIAALHAGSNTALYDAIYLGSQALSKRQGRKVMVLITDGGDNGSNVSYQEALRAAQQSEALLYSVIIVPIEASAGRNTGGEHALIQLARDTGAQAFYADSSQQLDHAFSQISTELRNQYLLAYYPAKRLADSDFRSISIQLADSPRTHGRQLSIRHRTGYYTSKLE